MVFVSLHGLRAVRVHNYIGHRPKLITKYSTIPRSCSGYPHTSTNDTRTQGIKKMFTFTNCNCNIWTLRKDSISIMSTVSKILLMWSTASNIIQNYRTINIWYTDLSPTRICAAHVLYHHIQHNALQYWPVEGIPNCLQTTCAAKKFQLLIFEHTKPHCELWQTCTIYPFSRTWSSVQGTVRNRNGH